MQDMVTGTIAMMDCLGFKGIWKIHDPEIILSKLKRIKDETEQNFQFADKHRDAELARRGLSSSLSTRILFLSDSIIVAAWHDGNSGPNTHLAMHHVCRICSMVLLVHAQLDPKLSLRGCVASGEFSINDNFYVGPAVDVAAEGMERADGAIVWLTDSSRIAFDKELRITEEWLNSPEAADIAPGMLPNAVVSYAVPLKEKGPMPVDFSTHAINPFSFVAREEASQLAKAVLATFGDRPDLRQKKETTRRFFDACLGDQDLHAGSEEPKTCVTENKPWQTAMWTLIMGVALCLVSLPYLVGMSVALRNASAPVAVGATQILQTSSLDEIQEGLESILVFGLSLVGAYYSARWLPVLISCVYAKGKWTGVTVPLTFLLVSLSLVMTARFVSVTYEVGPETTTHRKRADTLLGRSNEKDLAGLVVLIFYAVPTSLGLAVAFRASRKAGGQAVPSLFGR